MGGGGGGGGVGDSSVSALNIWGTDPIQDDE